MRRAPYAIGAGVATTLLVVLVAVPDAERFRIRGPSNTGHETLACEDCHTRAEGTARQQVQANALHLLGARDTGADFVHTPVGNDDCLACHVNPADRHPTSRFEEPRFAEARAAIAPTRCTSCHREHSGRRVTIAATFCESCHGELALKDDPARPTHAELVGAARWQTCLQCHDFHGNHLMTTPRTLEAGASTEAIERYFGAGESPWGQGVRFEAREVREDR